MPSETNSAGRCLRDLLQRAFAVYDTIRTRRPARRFWSGKAAPQNAVELFAGQWASDLAEVLPVRPHAGNPMFVHDPRPRQAAAALGENGRLDGLNVLELGPLEGAHSYQLEQLGARQVLAIESNADAFLRCLVVKNPLALRTTYLLGDCTRYLAAEATRYDLVFASGILYHMEDPLELIRLIAARTDKLFLWTQYHDESFRSASGQPLHHRRTMVERDGLHVPVYQRIYRRRFRADFFGGIGQVTHWLELDTIVAALRHYGFDDVRIIETDPHGEHGPAATLAARRSRAEPEAARAPVS